MTPKPSPRAHGPDGMNGANWEHLGQWPHWALGLVGALGLLLTGARWNLAILAWVTPVPILLMARRLERPREWAALGGLLAAALTLQVLKLMTEPVNPVMAIGFSLPAAGGMLAVVALTEWARRRSGEQVGVIVFAGLSALGDLASYAGTELGAWTASANTQVSSTLVMQLAAVVGLWGIGFLMAWVAGLAAALVGGRREPWALAAWCTGGWRRRWLACLGRLAARGQSARRLVGWADQHRRGVWRAWPAAPGGTGQRRGGAVRSESPGGRAGGGASRVA